MSTGADSLKSVLYALGANFGIAVAKTVAAVMTNSGSMLAEAIHSYADCGNQGLLLWGMKASKRVPDEDHPLGYGKAIYFWSFLVALLLFTVGGGFSIYEGLHKLAHPEPISAPWIAIGVLVFAIALESVSMRACMREVKKVLAGRSYWQWFKESRQAELVVIFGEDLAALLGLCLALVAVVMTLITGNLMWDALGSISIGALLILVAIFVGLEVKALLIGQSADRPVREGIEAYLQRHASVDKVLRVLTLHLGDDVMVAVKAQMHEKSTARALCESINDAEAGLKKEFPQVKWVFFEPDICD